jgi:hypothetical protein
MFGGLHGFAVHSAAVQSCLGIFEKRKEEFKFIIGFFLFNLFFTSNAENG